MWANKSKKTEDEWQRVVVKESVLDVNHSNLARDKEKGENRNHPNH
jgi:hypothetical protein